MLTVRKQQLDALGAYMRQSFEDRVAQHLVREWPLQVRKLLSAGGSEKPVRDLIQLGIQKAARYGIESEADVMRFIELMVRILPEFDEQKELGWARAILDDRSLPGAAKIGLIQEQLPLRMPEMAAAGGTSAPN